MQIVVVENQLYFIIYARICCDSCRVL